MITADCQNCERRYHIPLDRLPVEKQVAFRCPACKGIIKLSRPADPEKQAPQPALKPLPPPMDEKGKKFLKDRILMELRGFLPSLPQILFKAQELMSNPMFSFKELASVIATDPGMSLRIMKLANSSYYGLSGKVTSIGHAIALLGSKVVGEIVIMAGSLNLMGSTLKGYGLSSGALWRHSLAVGLGAKIICKKRSPDIANDAFTSGVIHDVGKIMLDLHVFERKEAFEIFLDHSQGALFAAEKHILGFDHSEIGAEICKTWGIPGRLVAAVQYHHYPSQSDKSDLVYIIHTANVIADMVGIGIDTKGLEAQMEPEAKVFLGLNREDMEKIGDEVYQLIEILESKMMAS